MIKKCKNTYLKIVIVTIIIMVHSQIIGLTSSCSVDRYETFSSSDPYLDFTFEYASNLNEDIQKYEEWPDSPSGMIEITLSSSLSTIFVDIIDATSDETASNFHKETYDQVSSWGENFEVRKNGNINIDGITSYDLECIYDNPQNSSSTERKYVRLNDRFITIERNGKFYLIRFITEASQSDSIRDFQHLLDTWRWK